MEMESKNPVGGHGKDSNAEHVEARDAGDPPSHTGSRCFPGWTLGSDVRGDPPAPRYRQSLWHTSIHGHGSIQANADRRNRKDRQRRRLTYGLGGTCLSGAQTKKRRILDTTGNGD